MELSKKKSYIFSFVGQGLPLEDAYEMVYASDSEQQALEADPDFMEQITEITLQLSILHLRNYNESVTNSKTPADHLRRLTILRQRVFDKEDRDKLPDLNITITKTVPSAAKVELS
jgi:hypothetical protein